MVKFHKSATNELNSEFDELIAELDYMEKTNKMFTTVSRSYGPKGTFDKSSGKMKTPVAIVPIVKKTLVESVKTLDLLDSGDVFLEAKNSPRVLQRGIILLCQFNVEHFPFTLNSESHETCILDEVIQFTQPVFRCPIRTVKGIGTDYTDTLPHYCPTNR